MKLAVQDTIVKPDFLIPIILCADLKNSSRSGCIFDLLIRAQTTPETSDFIMTEESRYYALGPDWNHSYVNLCFAAPFSAWPAYCSIGCCHPVRRSCDVQWSSRSWETPRNKTCTCSRPLTLCRPVQFLNQSTLSSASSKPASFSLSMKVVYMNFSTNVAELEVRCPSGLSSSSLILDQTIKCVIPGLIPYGQSL